MESGNILFSIIIMALIIIPFVWMYVARNNNKKNLQKTFSTFAGPKGFSSGNIELYNQKGLAIDTNQKLVCFTPDVQTPEVYDCLSFEQIKECKVRTLKKSVTTASGSSEIIDKIQLVFVLSQGGEKVFDLFSLEKDFQVSDQLSKSEKWSQQINSSVGFSA